MRLGTQTLIQALQALPWDDREDGDADTFSSDEEDNAPCTYRPTRASLSPAPTYVPMPAAANDHLASSIHAIHLPVARSRHNTILSDIHELPQSRHTPQPTDDVELEATIASELDAAGPDFEQPSTRGSPASEEPDPVAFLGEPEPRHTSLPRSQSMTTIRQNRRARLAEKLAEVFELNSIREVIAGASRRVGWIARTAHGPRRVALLAPALSP